MAQVGTRSNPGSGGLGISFALGGKNDEEIKKQRESKAMELWNTIISNGGDTSTADQVAENYRQTGQISLPATHPVALATPAEGPTLPGQPQPMGSTDAPFVLGKPQPTRGIAFIDKSKGTVRFQESPYDQISQVDYGIPPTKPTEADTRKADEIKRVTTMVKGALKTGQILMGGQQIPVKTKDDITNALMSGGYDPTSDANLAAVVDQFPESEPPSKFMDWWNGVKNAGEKLFQPSQNDSGQTRQYNGFTYRKEADGKWHKLK